MKSCDQWLVEYGESHKNAINIAIHKICVPVIFFCVLGFFWPVEMSLLGFDFRMAMLVAAVIVLFYLFLSIPLAIGMSIQCTAMLAALHAIDTFGIISIFSLSIFLFTVAWIFQFIGHKIEGRKPSFFADLLFLTIGPLWTLSYLFRKMGIKY